MLDKGAKGITGTIRFWKKYSQVALIGINESQSDRNRTRTIERNGVKIAFLAYTYGTNGYKVPSGQDYLINLIDRAAIKKDVERAKGEADAVVVSMHWGVEYSTTTSSTQTSLAQYLADLGVDLVIGHHPHVIQRVNWVTGSGGKRLSITLWEIFSLFAGKSTTCSAPSPMCDLSKKKRNFHYTSKKSPRSLPNLNMTAPKRKLSEKRL